MFVVIFRSKKKPPLSEDYQATAQKLTNLAKEQNGFIKMESFIEADGRGVTLIYWETLADLKVWKANPQHLEAQGRGKSEWYESYSVEVCEVREAYEGPR